MLVTLRAIQGFAVGGEWGGAALMAVENAPKNKKAFYDNLRKVVAKGEIAKK